jgi:hypothetical protein
MVARGPRRACVSCETRRAQVGAATRVCTGIPLAPRVDMFIALLPVLSLATAETIAFDSQEQLEDVLSVRLRSSIVEGWTLVDVSQADDGNGLGFTLTRDGDAVRHLVSFGEGNLYRIEPGEVPEDPTAPSDRMLEALHGRGGVELGVSCGGYYEQPYLIDDSATGSEARALVARSLAAADDLEAASMTGRRAIFQLQTDGAAVDLVVTLTEEGGVAQAELRRHDLRGDDTSYRRRSAMARALRSAFVSSIHSKDGGIVLRTSRGRFALDPDGSAFRSKHGSDEYEGCGC